MQAPYYAQGVEDDDEILAGHDVDFGVDFAPNEGTFGDDAQAAALIAEAQQRQQQQQQAEALAAVPDAIKKYIVSFHNALQNNALSEITAAYEGSWNRLTEKYYAKTEWPEAEVIAPLVQEDQLFLTLYRELWFRHVYSRLSPAGEDRFNSYDNYCDFFNYVLNSEGPVALDLPPQWLWDIVDEFIYQFQSYSQWRNRVTGKTEDELALLQDGGVWSSYSVLNVLYSLIQKSKILEQLAAAERDEDPSEVAGQFGNQPLYKLLGYFSVIGLLRVHVLLGDYTLALKMLDHVELNKKSSLITRVTACHVATYYYIGFAYMMLGRYPDAVRSFTHILVFIMRLRQYHTRSYQYDQISKTADRMHALLTICCALCPTRLDENLQSTMREKYGEQLSRMMKGNRAAFEELFVYASPKFITTASPPYNDVEAMNKFDEQTLADPALHQLKVFMADVSSQLVNTDVRSFIKLYKSLGTDKLADFLGTTEEDVIEMMMLTKSSTRKLRWQSGGLLEGEVINTSDLDFNIDDTMINVAELKVGRRYGDWFLRNGTRMHDALRAIKAKPLPLPAQPSTPANPSQPSAGTRAPTARPVKPTAWAAAAAR